MVVGGPPAIKYRCKIVSLKKIIECLSIHGTHSKDLLKKSPVWGKQLKGCSSKKKYNIFGAVKSFLRVLQREDAQQGLPTGLLHVFQEHMNSYRFSLERRFFTGVPQWKNIQQIFYIFSSTSQKREYLLQSPYMSSSIIWFL